MQFLVWLSVGGRGGEEAVTHAGSSHAGPFVPPEISPISRSPPPPPARTHATGRERISATQSSSLYGGGRLICGLWSGRLLPPPPKPSFTDHKWPLTEKLLQLLGSLHRLMHRIYGLENPICLRK